MEYKYANDIKQIELQSVNKTRLNNLILNYLIVEGYETAAIKFSKEIGFDLLNIGSYNGHKASQLKLSVGGSVSGEKYSSLINGLQSIKQRNEIKLLLLKNEISTIITKLNEYYPFLLENNDFLYFKILLLNLIEIIKKHQRENSNSNSGVQPEGGTRKNSISGRKKSISDNSKRKRRLSSTSSLTDKKRNRRKSSVAGSKISTEELRKEQQFFNTIISFVKDKLFHKAIKNKFFLHELELSMCLLLFDFKDFQNNDLSQNLPKELLNLINNKNFKNEVFNLINNAILNYNSRYLTLASSHNVVTDAGSSSLVNPSISATVPSATTLDAGSALAINSLNSRSTLSNDYMNNNEGSKYRNNYVFYDTDSDSDGNNQDLDGDEEMGNHKNKHNNIDELLFDDGDNNEEESSKANEALGQGGADTDALNAAEELNNHYLANNVNSKFKQLINLWIWSENVFNDMEQCSVPRVDLEKLLSIEG